MALKPIDPAPQYPSGGMSDADTGGQDVQTPALAAKPNYDNANADGEQTPPAGDGTNLFGMGPAVIQNVGGGEKVDCCPGKPGCEPTDSSLEKY